MGQSVDLIGKLVVLLAIACGVLFILTRLRLPPVVGYLRGGRLLLDLRTVDPEDDPLLVAAVRAALAG